MSKLNYDNLNSVKLNYVKAQLSQLNYVQLNCERHNSGCTYVGHHDNNKGSNDGRRD